MNRDVTRVMCEPPMTVVSWKTPLFLINEMLGRASPCLASAGLSWTIYLLIRVIWSRAAAAAAGAKHKISHSQSGADLQQSLGSVL